jgi:ParB-like chromosome segregation protein Spo0J
LADGIPVHCSCTVIASIDEVTPRPGNPKGHPDAQIRLLAKVIRAQGWRNPIVVSTRSQFITKGHARYLAAKLLGVTRVPVDLQPYASERQEMADVLADNRLAELGEMNLGALKDILGDLDTGEIDLELTGYTEKSIENLMAGLGLEDDENVVIKIQVPRDEADEYARVLKKFLADHLPNAKLQLKSSSR